MGSVVSNAHIQAAQMVSGSALPPPEFPIHQKDGASAKTKPTHPEMQATTVSVSESPVKHDNSNVSPSNIMPPANQNPAPDQPSPHTDRQTSTIPKITADVSKQFENAVSVVQIQATQGGTFFLFFIPKITEDASKQLGNAVAIAQIPVAQGGTMPTNHDQMMSGSAIPAPELPMHQKDVASATTNQTHSEIQTTTVSVSESPVKHDNSNVRPSNIIPPANQNPAPDQPSPHTDRQTSTTPKITADVSKQFENAVSIAQIQVAQGGTMPTNHDQMMSGSAIPAPDFPMHQKDVASATTNQTHSEIQATTVSVSESPVKHDNRDVRPSNIMPPANQNPASDEPLPLPTDRQTSTIAKVTKFGSKQFWNGMHLIGWRGKNKDVGPSDTSINGKAPDHQTSTIAKVTEFGSKQFWNGMHLIGWRGKNKDVGPSDTSNNAPDNQTSTIAKVTEFGSKQFWNGMHLIGWRGKNKDVDPSDTSSNAPDHQTSTIAKVTEFGSKQFWNGMRLIGWRGKNKDMGPSDTSNNAPDNQTSTIAKVTEFGSKQFWNGMHLIGWPGKNKDLDPSDASSNAPDHQTSTIAKVTEFGSKQFWNGMHLLGWRGKNKDVGPSDK